MLKIGASSICITPETSQFLCGYPHVKRYSNGVDTDLMSAALCLDDGETQLIMIANDLLYLSRMTVATLRSQIAAASSVPAENIMITCTHTHSGPGTVERIARARPSDLPPPPDPSYLDWLCQRIVAGAVKAVESRRPGYLALGLADSSQVGCNRRDPQGPKNPVVPVMIARDLDNQPVAVMMVVSVHPTVLHEDSPLVSADFPGYCKLHIQNELGSIPVIYHTGPAGNQSPRHLTRENTTAEAKRLGELLGESAINAIKNAAAAQSIVLKAANAKVDLPLNLFPAVQEMEKVERAAREKFERMQREGVDPKATRTAECDWFGAERRLCLSRHFQTGKLREDIRQHIPAEVQVFCIGQWRFVAWPGETFVEYGLELKTRSPNTFPVAYANGETQGYLVTAEAVAEGGYEASTAMFKSPESPQLLVKHALLLLEQLEHR